jgi:hypothetical protein
MRETTEVDHTMIQKIERIFIIVILLLFCLKAFLHWSVSPLLIILLSIFSMYSVITGVVLFNGIHDLSQEGFSPIKQWRIAVGIFLGIAAATCAIGFEFRIFLWQGAPPLLGISAAIFLLGALLSGYFLFQNKEASFKVMFTRSVCWLCFAVFFLLLPNSELIDIYYHRYPDYARAFKNYDAHPDDSAALAEWELEKAKLDSLWKQKR